MVLAFFGAGARWLCALVGGISCKAPRPEPGGEAAVPASIELIPGQVCLVSSGMAVLEALRTRSHARPTDHSNIGAEFESFTSLQFVRAQTQENDTAEPLGRHHSQQTPRFAFESEQQSDSLANPDPTGTPPVSTRGSRSVIVRLWPYNMDMDMDMYM